MTTNNTSRETSSIENASCGHCNETPSNTYGYTKSKTEYINRLRRVEGQVRGLQKMVAGDSYCIDILTQVSAVTKALQAVALGLLDDHMNSCVLRAAHSSTEEGQAKLAEVSTAIARLCK